MEQIVLYLAVLAALSGFGMGLMNIAGPYLKRRNLTLPQLSLATLLRRDAHSDAHDDDDYDLDEDQDLEAARALAESSFTPSTLLRPRVPVDPDEELDDELAGVLDQVASEPLEPYEEDEAAEEEDGPAVYRVHADESDADAAGFEEEDGDATHGEDEDEDFEDEEAEEAEPQAAAPEVHVVAAASTDGDMLSFFSESEDAAGKAHLAWRDDLPDVSIAELLAEAREVRQQIKGKKPDAA